MQTNKILLNKIRSYPADCEEKCRDIQELTKVLVNYNPAEAVKWCITGLRISRKLGYENGESLNDTIGIANVYGGNFFDALCFFNIALAYYLNKIKQPLSKAERRNAEINASKVRNNIAIVYENIGLMEEAIAIHQGNLKYYCIEGLKKDALLSYLNISSVAIHSANYNLALKAIDSFFTYYNENKMQEPLFEGMAYVNRIEAECGLKEKPAADISPYLKSVAIFRTINNVRMERLVYICLIAHYNKTGQFNEMAMYADKALALSQKANLNEQQDRIYELLYNYYKKQKNLSKALEYLELLNLEKEAKKKNETMASLAKKQMRTLLKHSNIQNTSHNGQSMYFAETGKIQVNFAKTVTDVSVLDITSIELGKNGYAVINTINSKQVKTTMTFAAVMRTIEATSHRQHFFYTHKRRQAINLVYKKEINKTTRTIILEYPGQIKTIPITIRQYYELLKLIKS